MIQNRKKLSYELLFAILEHKESNQKSTLFFYLLPFFYTFMEYFPCINIFGGYQ